MRIESKENKVPTGEVSVTNLLDYHLQKQESVSLTEILWIIQKKYRKDLPWF